MNFKRLLLFLAAPLALVMGSCTPEGPEYTIPSITITDAEGKEVTAIGFAAENPENAALPQEYVVTIKSTRSWSISKEADWLGVSPADFSNTTQLEQTQEVKFTAVANEEGPRSQTVKVTMDKITKEIVVSQAGAGQTALGDEIFYDDFDKKVAEKDSNNYWPYMSAEYGNPTPENQSGVTYASKNVTVRANSNSDGSYSDYAGSGSNNIFFGKTPTYLTISGISLAELEGNALTMTFGTEKYSQDNGSTFTESEFHVYLSADGEKWTEIDYTFAGTADGRWNLATAQFNLKEVPESVSIAFIVDVASSYRLDDLKLTEGGGGVELDLSQGIELDLESGSGSGSTGGDNTPIEKDPNAQTISVAEFIQKAETETTYQLTGTISGSINTQYGNFDLVDESGSIYIYGLKDESGANVDWAAKGLNAGDVITVQGKYYLYTGSNGSTKHEIVNALYISHVDGEEPEAPEVVEGAFTSDAAFVCSTDDSANAVYGLAASTVNGAAATGFKLGKSKQEGKFTSTAVGVSGDKYLNFYAVSWGAGGDKTIYFRVNGGEVMSQAIKANSGATGNPPYTITVTDSDHYSVLLSGLSESDIIEFSSNAAFDCATTTDYATRAIFFGVKLTDEPLAGEGGGTTEPEEPETPAEAITVAEFIEKADTATAYKLTGTIVGPINTQYGNFDIEDESGKIYVYGLKDEKGTTVDWAATGLDEGDTITIEGKYYYYADKSKHEVVDAVYISHVDVEGGETPEEPEQPEEPETPVDPEEPAIVKVTVAEFKAAAEDETVYELTGVIKDTYNTYYGNFYLEDETGDVLIYGILNDGEKCYESLGLVDGDVITVQGTRVSFNGAAQMKNAEYVSHIVNTTPRILSIDATSLTFTADAAEKTIKVTTAGEGGTLEATTAAEWLTVSVADGVVTVAAAANEGEARDAEVTVTFGDSSETVAVSQGAPVADGAEVTDVIDSSFTGVTGTNYVEWSGKTNTSGAVYAGLCAGDAGTVQLRNKNSNEGIVTTTSGGKVTKIVITWNTTKTTNINRTVDIYGSHTAFSQATDMYSSTKADATKIASAKLADATDGVSEVVLDGTYEFVGFRSNSSALYLDSVEITWVK